MRLGDEQQGVLELGGKVPSIDFRAGPVEVSAREYRVEAG